MNEDAMIILFNGKELDDDSTLYDCGLRKGSVIVCQTEEEKPTVSEVKLTLVNLASGEKTVVNLQESTPNDIIRFACNWAGKSFQCKVIGEDGKILSNKTDISKPTLNLIVIPVGA